MEGWITLALAIAPASCNGSSESDGPDGGPIDVAPDAGTDGPDSPWPELTVEIIDVGGGAAMGSGGVGAGGGTIELASGGAVSVDPEASVPGAPAAPRPPAGGVEIGPDELAADVNRAETLRLSGGLQVSGGDLVRTITSSGGDIVVDGTLRSAALDGGRQGIELRAPNGTVFIAGAVVTGGDGSRTLAGGAITITARRVVLEGGRLIATGAPLPGGSGAPGGAITIAAAGGPVLITAGVIDTSGGGGREGGGGGPLIIEAAEAVSVASPIDTSGGDGSGGGAVSGGPGGGVLVTGSEVSILEPVIMRGGAAMGDDGEARGGDAGTLDVASAGVARVAAVIDGRGGPAATAGGDGDVKGGAAGTVRLAGASVEVAASLGMAGGAGLAEGGAGGDLALHAASGDVRLAGAIDFGGGDSEAQPGAGGRIDGEIGDAGGGLQLAGSISGRGGSALPGGDADGGDAGQVWMAVLSLAGPITIAPTAEIVLDGGDSAGAGTGGTGGVIDLRARDGNASLDGQLHARGGDAPGAGGTGGTGGRLHIWTDTNFDGIGGHLIVEQSGLIDISGGSGETGGNACNNGEGGVAYFPEGIETIGILFNSDSAPGRLEDGELVNKGRIVAKGGAGGGSGGDVIFHGRRAGSSKDPVPGAIDLSGDGDGADGSFASQ